MALYPLRAFTARTVNFIVLGNSVTIKEGDVITVATTGGNAGFAVPVTAAGQRVLGVVRNIRKIDGTYIKDANGRPITSITTSANNITTDLIGVEYYPAWLPILFVGDTSANLGTTAGSTTPGFFNISTSNAGIVNESSFVRTESTTPEHLIGYGPNGGNLRKLICRFNPKMVL